MNVHHEASRDRYVVRSREDGQQKSRQFDSREVAEELEEGRRRAGQGTLERIRDDLAHRGELGIEDVLFDTYDGAAHRDLATHETHFEPLAHIAREVLMLSRNA